VEKNDFPLLFLYFRNAIMAKTEQKKPTVDNLIATIEESLKKEYNITVDKSKIKGVAFTALKQAGLLTREDKFKNYDHVGKIQKLFNDAFGEILEWEDIEYFTGNLFFAMRLATRRPIERINELLVEYQKRGEPIDIDTLNTDLTLLVQSMKDNMTETSSYIERTQLSGVSMIINKIIKLLDKKNV
jgi:hypothetical protein